MDGFTGFNVHEVDEVLRSLKNSYDTLGDKMATPWPALQQAMQDNWVGPDEQSYEERFAKDVCNLYIACKDVIQTLITNIAKLGQSWEEFQKNNIIDGAETHERYGLISYGVKLDDNSISDVVKLKVDNGNYKENRGLVNGDSSYNIINNAIDTYVNDVKNEVNTLYQGIVSGKAFLGGGQAQEIDGYITRIGVAVGALSTSHDAIRAALQQLLINYRTQAQNVAQAASGAGQEQ